MAMLQARVKLSGYRELQGAGWSPMGRALCGYIRCREELAVVTLVRMRPGAQATAWSAALAAGYRQYAPGQWALGRHAQRSRRHAPRRPRFTGLASAQPAPGYVRDGVFTVRGPAHQPDMPLQTAYDSQGRLASAAQELPLALTDTLTMTCARCGRVSLLTVPPLRNALVEAPSEAASSDLSARGSAEVVVPSSPATMPATAPITVPREERRRRSRTDTPC